MWSWWSTVRGDHECVFRALHTSRVFQIILFRIIVYQRTFKRSVKLPPPPPCHTACCLVGKRALNLRPKMSQMPPEYTLELRGERGLKTFWRGGSGVCRSRLPNQCFLFSHPYNSGCQDARWQLKLCEIHMLGVRREVTRACGLRGIVERTDAFVASEGPSMLTEWLRYSSVQDGSWHVCHAWSFAFTHRVSGSPDCEYRGCLRC